MFVYLGLYLHTLLCTALGHTIPEADHTGFVPDSEGDLLFLLDSSGSVTYDEFANVKKFIGDLLRPFKFGPQDVQASVVQISTDPTLEFPLNQHTSSQDVQKAIHNIRQRMGDTNTGKALDYVKEQLYSEKFGSRTDVPKVMVWMTDGLSTDDISKPMQLLKDMGVTVFIVCTTGRGNFQELSTAASQPDEKYLKFVDKDDLGIITKELRDSIIELIQAKRLHALDITSTSFRLMWPRLLSRNTGHYVLEYAPVSYQRQKTQETLPGDQTSLPLFGLTPNTTYQVTLYPESNVDYVSPQSIQVSTLHEITEERKLEADDITTTGFRVTWSRLSGDTGSYLLDYSIVSDPRTRLQKALFGDETSVILSNLLPNTTYRVTLSPGSADKSVQPETIVVTTLPDLIKARNLNVLNVTATSFLLSWVSLPGDTGRYSVNYVPVSIPGVISQMFLYRETSAAIRDLTANTSYEVTFIPLSNVQVSQSQTLQVSTLPGLIQTRNLQAVDITATTLRLVWSRLTGDGELYVLEYFPISDPRLTQQKILYGVETNVMVGGLLSNTTYQITLYPQYSVQHVQPEVIMVSTKIDPVHERNLQVKDITSTSFLITWSKLPMDSGSYTIEYAPTSDLRETRRKTFSENEDRALIGGLTPDNTYRVTLIPESNAPDIQDVTIQVSTLPDLILARNLHIKDKTSTSFQLAWSRLSGDTGNYLIEYAPVTDLGKKVQKTLYGDLTSVVFSHLTPSTTYEVTFTPQSRESTSQSQTMKVTTLPGLTQKRNLHAWDISSSSFRLTWSRLTTDRGRYVLEYGLVADLQNTLRKMLSDEETTVLIGNLNPDTKYQATLYSEANVQNVPPQSIQMTTLPEQFGPAQILISDPTAHSFRVSWGPYVDGVIGYEIQYGPLPSNSVQKVQVDSRFNSTVIEGLKSNTTYLVTVSAIFKSGGEKALSAIACTEISGTKVKYLRIEDLQSNSLKAVWGSADGDVQGYQIRCRRQAGHSSEISVAPETRSVQLTGLAEGSTTKVCVKPVYKNGAGKNLCKKVQMHPGTPANSYSRRAQ